MKIKNLSIEHLEIPFKIAFSHSSATRTMTDSALVKVSSESHSGFGESCPRPYVTNETYSSVDAFFNVHHKSILESITDLSSLKNWINKHVDQINNNPAAFCAIELAILDLLAKEAEISVESLLEISQLSGEYQYTAVLGDSSLVSFTKLLTQFSAMKFTDYKLKLSGKLEHDKAKCDILLKQVKHPRIRLDANNLWKTPEEVIEYIKQLNHPFFALEEPLQVNDYKGLSVISQALDINIIVDESLIQIEQLKHLLANPSKWIINIRISKMGGVIRSLSIAENAKSLGINCIVGAQVGETSILTRAAILLANEYRDIITAQEGACGTYLLENDICDPVLMFGAKGVLSEDTMKQLTKDGFGLSLQ